MKNVNLIKLDDLCQQLSVVMTTKLNRVSYEIIDYDKYKIVKTDSSGFIEFDLSGEVDYNSACEVLKTAIHAVNYVKAR